METLPTITDTKLSSRIIQTAFWLMAIASIIFYLFYLAPRKGFDFTDMGFYLYSSWANATPGMPMDSLSYFMPAFFVNALFFKLGITHYLAHERIFYMITIFASIIFIVGIDKKLLFSPVLPLTILLVLACNYMTIFSYENGPALFLMIFFGCFYLAIAAKQNISKISLFIFAALMLFLSGFINIALLPGPFIVAALLTVMYRKENFFGVFLTFFLLFSSVIIFFYIKKIGVDNVFTAPGSHYVIEQILSKALTITTFLLLWLVFFAGVFLALNILKKYIKIPFSDNSIAVFFFLLFVGLYTIATFRFLPYLGMNYVFIANFAQIGFFSCCCALIFLSQNTKKYQACLLIFIATCFYFFDHAIITNNPKELQFIYYGPIFFSITLILVYDYFQTNKIHHKAIIVTSVLIWFAALLLGIIIQLNFSYRDDSPRVSKVDLTVPLLTGIKATAGRADFINLLVAAYQANDCKDKAFLTFADQPLLYYIFQRPALGGRSWLAPRLTYPTVSEDELIASLNQAKGWCVFVTQGYDTNEGWANYLLQLRNKVTNESTKTIPIAMGASTYMIYIK